MIDTVAMELGFRTGLSPTFASKFNWRPLYDWRTGVIRGISTFTRMDRIYLD